MSAPADLRHNGHLLPSPRAKAELTAGSCPAHTPPHPPGPCSAASAPQGSCRAPAPESAVFAGACVCTGASRASWSVCPGARTRTHLVASAGTSGTRVPNAGARNGDGCSHSVGATAQSWAGRAPTYALWGSTRQARAGEDTRGTSQPTCQASPLTGTGCWVTQAEPWPGPPTPALILGETQPLLGRTCSSGSAVEPPLPAPQLCYGCPTSQLHGQAET